jgi:hypothetical protein
MAPQSQLFCRTLPKLSQRRREPKLCCNFAIISTWSWKNRVAVKTWKCQIAFQSAHVVVCVLTCAEQRIKCGSVRRIKWVQSVFVTVRGGALQENSALHRHRSNHTCLSKMLDLLSGECNFALSWWMWNQWRLYILLRQYCVILARCQKRFSAFFDVLRYLIYLNKLFKWDRLRNVECRITCYQLIIEDVVGSKV